MKNIALLGPSSKEEIWNIPISFYNHFKKLGFNVKLYNTLVNDSFNDKNLKIMIDDYKTGVFIPDIVFHLDFGLFNSDLLNRQFIPTAKWVIESGDDPQNFNLNFNKIYKKGFDLILTPDIRCARQYLQKGENAVWCPHFADPDQFENVKQVPIFDATTTRSIEEPFFKKLKQSLRDRFEARQNYLYGIDHSIHLCKGRIVVQNSKYKEISRRIFEGMMANRMVLTDRPSIDTRIDLIFEENKDIVYFDGIEDCIKKINFYSLYDDKRTEISTNGFNKVKNFHTTKSRINKILELLTIS